MDIVKNILDMFDCKGTITINNKTYTGDNIQISGNKVIIDGIVQNTDDLLTGPINIVVNGNVGSLKSVTGDIKAYNIGTITTTSGKIHCGDVGGNINTISGDVRCTTINGNVKTVSGDIIGVNKSS